MRIAEEWEVLELHLCCSEFLSKLSLCCSVFVMLYLMDCDLNLHREELSLCVDPDFVHVLFIFRFSFRFRTQNPMPFNGDYLSAFSPISATACHNLTTSMSYHGPNTSLSSYPPLGLVTRG